MENIISFDHSTCKKCNLCAEVCPCKIIYKTQPGEMAYRTDRIHVCLKCGQCMAVCPTKSIQVQGLSYQHDFFDFPSDKYFINHFYELIATRRAIRNFTNKPVPDEIMQKILDAVAMAPPGFPPIKTEIMVINKPELIKQALPAMIEMYDWLYNAFNKPVMRFFIKQKVGPKKFKTMRDHLIPLLKTRLPELKAGTQDTLTRNAPALLLFCCNRNSEDIYEDAYIAATYAMLAAHSLGLGGSIMSIIPPAFEKSKKIREMFQIPEETEIITSVILGYPKYKYARGIKREIKNIKWY